MALMKEVTYTDGLVGKARVWNRRAEGGPEDEAELQVLNRKRGCRGSSSVRFLLDKHEEWSSAPSTHEITKHAGTCLKHQNWEKGAGKQRGACFQLIG